MSIEKEIRRRRLAERMRALELYIRQSELLESEVILFLLKKIEQTLDEFEAA